jgi:hypothetical protein
LFLYLTGDGYTISQLGSSSVSYPNSPIQDYVAPGHHFMVESELQDHESGISDHYHHLHHHQQQHHSNHQQQQQHRHHPPQQRESPAVVAGHNNLLLGPSATLGRHSGRFGSRKSPFQVVIPSGGSAGGHNKLTCPPPVCSTPQGGGGGGGGDSMLPILGALGSPNRALPEFSTFGSSGGGYLTKFRGDEERHSNGGSLEPSGHLD